MSLRDRFWGAVAVLADDRFTGPELVPIELSQACVQVLPIEVPGSA